MVFGSAIERRKRSKSKKNDENAVPKFKKGAFNQAGKLKTGLTSLAKPRPRKKGALKKKALAESTLVQDEVDGSLFAKIRSSYIAIEGAVERWIDQFSEKDSEQAIADLISFVLQASGCVAGEIPAKKINNKRINQILESIIEEHFPEKMDSYPVVSNHASFKQFNKNFLTFWNRLILNCSDSIIFEELFSKTFFRWLKTMSEHRIRALRHTATLAAYQIMDTLISVNFDLQKDLEKAQKQKKKKTKKQQKEISSQIKELNGQIESIEDIMADTLMEKFAQKRYLDASPNIRGLTVECMGTWILDYPDLFLEDKYTKHLGWLLNDRNAGVREKALKALERIYEEETFHGQMAKFTTKFLPRYVELISDTEIGVAVTAIKFLTLLFEEGLLTVDDHQEWIEDIEECLFDENASIRYAAGEFVMERLNRLASERSKKKKRGRKKNDEEGIQWSHFVDFLQQQEDSDDFEQSSMASHLVDNIWDKAKILQNFDLMKEAFDQCSERDFSTLLSLIEAVVRKTAAKGEPLHTTTSRDHFKAKKSKKKIDYDELLSNLTAEFVEMLPGLLKKYQSEAGSLGILLRIPQSFRMTAIDEYEQTDNFKKLIKSLRDLVWKHNDSGVLQALFGTLGHFIDPKQQYSQRSLSKDVVESISRELKTKLGEAIEEAKDNDNDNVLLYAIQRMLRASQAFPLDLGVVRSNCLELVKARSMGGAIGDDTSIAASNLILLDCAQRCQSTKNSSDLQESLSTFCQEFHDQLIVCLDSENLDLVEKRQYFDNLSDLFVFFTTLKVDGFTVYRLQTTLEQEGVLGNFLDEALQWEQEAMQDEGPDEIQLQYSQRQLIFGFEKICPQVSTSLQSKLISFFVGNGPIVSDSIKKSLQFWRQNELSTGPIEQEALKLVFADYLRTKGAKKRQAALDQFEQLAHKLATTHFYGRDQETVYSIVDSLVDYSFGEEQDKLECLYGTIPFISRLTPERARELRTKLQQLFKKTRQDAEDYDEVYRALDRIAKKDTEDSKEDEEEESEATEGNVTKKLEFSKDDQESETSSVLGKRSREDDGGQDKKRRKKK